MIIPAVGYWGSKSESACGHLEDTGWCCGAVCHSPIGCESAALTGQNKDLVGKDELAHDDALL